MKKILSIVALLLMAVTWNTVTAVTYSKGSIIRGMTTEGIEISFRVIDPDAKTCEIAYSCISSSTSGKITVPDYVEGFKVVEAHYSAFSGSNISSVVLPSNLEKLGEWAFYNCKKLTSITIPSKIKDIPRYTFYGCESLSSVKFPTSLESIGFSAFSRCETLEAVALPSTLRSIDESAFYRCTNLKKVTGIANVEFLGSGAFNSTQWEYNLPDGMVYIGKVAYKYKGTIPENTTINIKEGTTCVSGDAFSGSGLVGITIPASVKAIGENPFGFHFGLKSITVAAGNRYYDSRNNCNAIIHTATNTLIAGCNTTVIPSTVRAIGYRAFCDADITSITIPDGVDSLAKVAFFACGKLKSVTIGKGVRKISNDIFGYCQNLKDIVVSSANPYFDSRSNCKGIVEKNTNTLVVGCTATVIPSTVKVIGEYAFYACAGSAGSGNTFYTISNQIEKIEHSAFIYNNNLRSVTIGHGVKEIGYRAFYGCDALVSIHALMDSPNEINEDVFESSKTGMADDIYNNATLYVPIGSRVNYLATKGWNKFKHIVETNGTDLIDGDVFTAKTVEGHLLTYQVTSRQRKTCILIASPTDIAGTVTIPVTANGFSIIAIDEDAFYGRNSERDLTSVTLPEGLVSIGDYALAYNENLVVGKLPSTLESIGKYAFAGCKNTSLHLPAKVGSIGNGIFYNCNELSAITVDAANPVYTSPAGSNAIIQKNNNTLIAGCKHTVVPDNVECIGDCAFYGIENLTAIDIPNSVAVIERYAFNATGVSNVTIPASVRSIGNYAFAYCNNLKTIYSRITSPFAITDNVFKSDSGVDNLYKTGTLYVPRGTKALYQATEGWMLFEHIEESDFDLERATIGDVDYLFNKSKLNATVKLIHADHSDVVIPEKVNHDGVDYQVTVLSDSVFCSDSETFIYSVTFPSTITTVSEKAFWRYNPSAIVWQSKTRIPEGAFNNPFYRGSNFLLYVNEASVAPSGVENLIVNGQADEIELTDAWHFNCPQEFTATKVSYTHNYTMQTGLGSCAGWETIALPFDVTTITHATKGSLTPFAAYQEGNNSKPFWLYSLSSMGFAKASAIKANTPYIISMPNNESYSPKYNIPGKVTFSAYNAKIHRTGEAYLNISTYNGGTFKPCYAYYLNSTNTYALNVPTTLVTDVGPEAPGSVFVTGSNIIINPFGARIEKTSAARIIEIIFADGETTAVQNISQHTGEIKDTVKVYNLSGQLVGIFNKKNVFGNEKQLPAGVYFVNGKKMLVK